MHSSDNISLATHLYGPPKGQPEEASFRCSCGRAYYAAFAHARDALLQASFQVDKSHKAHGQVVTWLKKSTIRDIKKVGGMLDDLRTKRNEADYDVGERHHRPFEKLQAGFVLASAQKIIATIDGEKAKSPKLGIR